MVLSGGSYHGDTTKSNMACTIILYGHYGSEYQINGKDKEKGKNDD